MAKSPDAFRTISEVAEWLGIQAHVLRFWESKFTQVKPIKRAGGRRYYRPGDMLLLGGIKKLLYEDGLTIKGVQKILREEGMSHVADMSDTLDELTLSQIGDTAPVAEASSIEVPEAEEEPRGVVLNFESSAATESDKKDTPATSSPDPEPDEKLAEGAPAGTAEEPKTSEASVEAATEQAVTKEKPVSQADETPVKAAEAAPNPTPSDTAKEPEADAGQPKAAPEDVPATEAEPAAALPSFMRRPTPEKQPEAAPTPEPAAEAEVEETSPERTAPAPAKPRIIDMPKLTPEAEIAAAPAVLAAAYRIRRIDKSTAAKVAPLLDRLTSHRDAMAARRSGGGAGSAKS
jgi:DNA-binding transcriptional MerR regulator